WASNAALACARRGRPPTSMSCLGRPAPSRSPTPPASTTATVRAAISPLFTRHRVIGPLRCASPSLLFRPAGDPDGAPPEDSPVDGALRRGRPATLNVPEGPAALRPERGTAA